MVELTVYKHEVYMFIERNTQPSISIIVVPLFLNTINKGLLTCGWPRYQHTFVRTNLHEGVYSNAIIIAIPQHKFKIYKEGVRTIIIFRLGSKTNPAHQTL